jgi:general secretion pathway protein J
VTSARSNDQTGFTLLEVLVAMALLGFLSTMLLGGVQLATRIMDSSRRHSDAAAAVPAAYEFLRTQIAQTLPIARENLPPGHRAVDFEGSSESLRIVTLAPSHLPPAAMGDTAYQSLLLQRDAPDNPNSVVIAWQPYWGGRRNVQQIAVRRSVLFEAITAMEISYFGTLDSGQPAAWHREWKNRPNLPTLVRIRLGRDGKEPLPELIVALPLSNNGL